MPNISMLTLKISLDETKPAVWRTIIVRGDMTLMQLHDRIQGAMGWCDAHLHLFKIGGIAFVDHRIWDDDGGMADENGMTLKKAKLAVGDTFSYDYDMGDDWSHTVTVLERTSVPMDRSRSWVVDGAMVCPPEDVGGVYGYEDFVLAMMAPDHDEHDSYRTWYGMDFAPTLFDLSAARRILFMLDHFGQGYPWQE